MAEPHSRCWLWSLAALGAELEHYFSILLPAAGLVPTYLGLRGVAWSLQVHHSQRCVCCWCLFPAASHQLRCSCWVWWAACRLAQLWAHCLNKQARMVAAVPGFILSWIILPQLHSWDLVNQTGQIQCRHGFAHVGEQLQAFHPTPLSLLY